MAVMNPYDLRKSAGFEKARPIGTGVAIIDTYISSLANIPLPPKQSWGGKRNDKARQSQYLSIDNVQNLMDAWRFSEHLGLYFNRFITIHLGKLGIDDGDAMPIISAFLKTMQDQIAKQGQIFAAIWVREFGKYIDEYGEYRGSHIHILAHIPDTCKAMVINRQCVWLRKAAGQPNKAGSLHGREITGYRPYKPIGAHYRVNAANVAAYLVKGANKGAIVKFGLPRVKYGGNIIGKRCGTTQNIGRAAQKRQNWQSHFKGFTNRQKTASMKSAQISKAKT